jgi:hypothetical protein
MAEALCLSNIVLFPFTTLLQFKEFTTVSHFTPFTNNGKNCTLKAPNNNLLQAPHYTAKKIINKPVIS